MSRAVGWAVVAFVVCLGMSGSMAAAFAVTVGAAVIGAIGQ